MTKRRNEPDAKPDDVQIMDGHSLELLNRAEIDVQIATAKQYPRSIARFQEEAEELATLDEETAASMFYSLPRGGKTIEGPSVRLAEVVAYSFTNLRHGGRIIEIGERYVTAQGVAHDLERNNFESYEVRRRITNSSGRRYNDDMIGTTCNAATSIAIRQAIFKVVPQSLVRPIYLAARLASIGDVKTLSSKRSDAIGFFGKMGVQPEQIFAALGVGGEADIGTEELITLRGLATAIKDRETTIEEVFPPVDRRRVRPSNLNEPGEPQETPTSNGEPKDEPQDSPAIEEGSPNAVELDRYRELLSRAASPRIARGVWDQAFGAERSEEFAGVEWSKDERASGQLAYEEHKEELAAASA